MQRQMCVHNISAGPDGNSAALQVCFQDKMWGSIVLPHPVRRVRYDIVIKGQYYPSSVDLERASWGNKIASGKWLSIIMYDGQH